MARKVEELEMQIAKLPPDELREFRAWYEKFDSDAWDRQIDEDIQTGKMDALADTALAEHKAGKSKKL
jgi:hypothetical protein